MHLQCFYVCCALFRNMLIFGVCARASRCTVWVSGPASCVSLLEKKAN